MIVTQPDPKAPKLISPDLDPCPTFPRWETNPATMVPADKWIRDAHGAATTIHVATERADGTPDLSSLRPRVLLVVRSAGQLVAFLLHPEVAQGWATGLAQAVTASQEAPKPPRAEVPDDAA